MKRGFCFFPVSDIVFTTMKPLHFHIITLFPEAIKAYLESSILGRAQKRKLIGVSLYQLRDFNKDKRKRVDDRPYAGGPGMVLRAEPVVVAVESIVKKIKNKNSARDIKVMLFGASGKQFTNAQAISIAKRQKHIILIAGRYEGVDARVKKILRADLSTKAFALAEEISVGPYILTGGELPAALLVDAITRHIPGVLGKDESVEERRVSSPEVYTRPEVLRHKGKTYRVPRVLLSGNHKDIEKWKTKRIKR